MTKFTWVGVGGGDGVMIFCAVVDSHNHFIECFVHNYKMTL